MEFIISSYHLNVNLKHFFENAVRFGICYRYMFCYHGESEGIVNPHWHIWCDPVTPASKALIASIFGVGNTIKDLGSLVRYFIEKSNGNVTSNFNLNFYAL